MERITIYPKEELKKKLEKEAQKQNRTLSNFILNVLTSYFEKKR